MTQPLPNLDRNGPVAPAMSADVLQASSKILFGSVSSSLLLLRPSGQIAFANDFAETMIGMASSEMEGVPLSSLFEAEDEKAAVLGPLNGSASSPTTRLNGQLRCRNGATLPVRVSLRAMQDAHGSLIGNVATIEDLSDAIQMGEYVQMMAHHDLPTGLPKVEAILSKVDAAIRKLQTTGESFALVEIGIDDFRRINESLGQHGGDRTLYEIGRRLRASLGPNDILARGSGDQFVVLFPHCATREDAMRLASELLRNFDEAFQIDDYSVRISAGFGVSFADRGSVSQSSIFTECELALRRSKSLGGSRVLCYEPAMSIWQSSTVQMESEMRAAIEREEFFVVYQPQICLKTGRLTGVEALLRWNSSTNGLVMPNSFIPFAEETGMIVPLGEWCLRTACREVVELQKRLGYPITLAVNVSPRQARAKGFHSTVQSALAESGLDPKYLEVEITEGLLISNEDSALRMIASLQEIGVSVAMDDFGMGFSNLGYITRFKVDKLKIDRSFVGRCTTDRSSKMITISILFLAKSLGIQVVAEGVETEEQAGLLAGLECDTAQGYLYSRPTIMEEIFKQADQFTPPKPMMDVVGVSDIAQTAWLSRISSGVAQDSREAARPTAPVVLPPAAVMPPVSTPAAMAAAASKKPVSAAPLVTPSGTFDYLEARDPICRPTHPARKPGAAKVRMQAVEDETNAYLVPQCFPGPQFKLMQ